MDQQLLKVALKPFEGNTAKKFSHFSVSIPAEDLRLAVIDGELGEVIHAPEPLTWPSLRHARTTRQGKRVQAVGGDPAR